jgi:hypothetical protein
MDSDQLAEFRRTGVVVIPDLFDEHEVEAMRCEADAIGAVALNSMLFHNRPGGRAGLGFDESGAVSLLKLQPFLDTSAVFQRVASDERVVGALAAIMGEEPILMPEKSKLNFKQRVREGGDALSELLSGQQRPEFGRFPIHNDYAYYRKQLCPPTALTSCIVLDDCSLDNGPLRMWPATHGEHIEHEQHPLGLQVNADALADGTVDPDAGVPVLASAGSYIIFQVTTVHASSHNATPAPRRLVIFAHCPASLWVPQLHPGNQQAVITEGAHELSYLRAVERGEFQPRAAL